MLLTLPLVVLRQVLACKLDGMSLLMLSMTSRHLRQLFYCCMLIEGRPTWPRYVSSCLEHGYTSLARWILPRQGCLFAGDFELACARGDLETLEWLYDEKESCICYLCTHVHSIFRSNGWKSCDTSAKYPVYSLSLGYLAEGDVDVQMQLALSVRGKHVGITQWLVIYADAEFTKEILALV